MPLLPLTPHLIHPTLNPSPKQIPRRGFAQGMGLVSGGLSAVLKNSLG